MFTWFRKKQQPTAKPKTLGQRGEEWAQEEYKKQGCEIVAANFFNPKGLRLGEVDFIAKKGDRLFFVEVKTRGREQSRFGTPAESVNVFKQQKLLKAVKVFLLRNRDYAGLQPQIDVCTVIMGELDNKPRRVIILPNAVEDFPNR